MNRDVYRSKRNRDLVARKKQRQTLSEKNIKNGQSLTINTWLTKHDGIEGD